MTPYDGVVSKGGFLKRNSELVGIAVRFMDLTIIVLGALIAHYIRFDVFPLALEPKIALLIVLFGAAIFFPLIDLYKPWRGLSIWVESREVVLAWLVIATIVPTLFYFTKTAEDFSRLWFGYWVLSTAVLLFLSRVMIRIISRWVRKQGINTRNILIVGAGRLGQRVSRNLRENDWTGMKVIGFLDDDASLHDASFENVPVLGGTSRLEELVDGPRESGLLSERGAFNIKAVDQVWVAMPPSKEEEIREVSRVLENSAIPIIFVPDIFLHSLLNHSVDELAGIPVINLRTSPFEGKASTLKLAEDIIVSLAAVVLFSPIMLIIAYLIKRDSPGPIIFKQRRYGIDGKEIIVWKFRSMGVMEDSEEVTQATRNDPRVTKTGAFLRKTSLDELPQFINVLQGRMSVVGPRPHAVAHNEEYRKIIDRYMWRSLVKPGITGLAQVNGWRGETDVPEKMEMRVKFDLEYLRNWSLWVDLKIIFLTVFTIFRKDNSY